MLTQGEVVKNWTRRYLHNVTPSKFGDAISYGVATSRVTRCQFYNFVEFIAKTEESVVFM